MNTTTPNNLENREGLSDKILDTLTLKRIINILSKDQLDSLVMDELNGSKKMVAGILTGLKASNIKDLNDLDDKIPEKLDDDFLGKLVTKLRNNLDLAYEIIKSFVSENKNFLEIKEFIENNFYAHKAKLFLFYRNHIQKVDKVLEDDLTKNLIFLSEKKSFIVSKLKDKKIIISRGKNIIINPKFLDEFEEKFEKINKENSNGDNENKLKLDFLLTILGINNEDLDENVLLILNSIINLSNIKKDKKQSKKEIEDIDKNEIAKKDKTEEERETRKIEEDFYEYDEGDLFEDRLDYCLPGSSFSFSSAGGGQINTSGNFFIKISEEEKSKFTSLALKNFVIFHQRLHRLGLNFLWDKYKSNFITLVSNRIGFDYLTGEGITESKTLGILNLIGKNIGIPEKEILGNDGETTKEVKCFKTLGEALLRFDDIKSSGKINGDEYSDNSMFSKGAVEKKLEENSCIDPKGKGLNINAWK